MKRFLFVCTGNICRSPLAQAVFEFHIKKEGLSDRFSSDSCATDSWEVGSHPDYRTIKVAKKYGIPINHIARKITEHDLNSFDYILVMDDYHFKKLGGIATAKQKEKIFYFTQFDKEASKPYPVNDPYCGGDEEFEETYRIIDKVTHFIIQDIKDGKF